MLLVFFLYNYLHGDTPYVFADYILRNRDIHHHETRGSVDLNVPYGRLDIRKLILKISGAKILRPRDRLISNMGIPIPGIPIPGKDGLYIETGPWCHWVIRTLHGCPSQMNENSMMTNNKLTSDGEIIPHTPASGSCCLPLGALQSMWATWCKI